MRSENIFLILGLLFGLIFCFVIPPLGVPDEGQHFLRAYMISNHKIVEKKLGEHNGQTIPVSLGKFVSESQPDVMNPCKRIELGRIIGLAHLPLNVHERVAGSGQTAAFYAPIAYLPQVIGISLGKPFNASPLILMYLGRIANLLAWIGLVYLAIRIAPQAKWLLLALAMMPMSITQASSLSADAVTTGLAFLLIALYLFYFTKEGKISTPQLILLLVLSLMLSLSKQAYTLIAFMLLTIPVKKFGGWKRYLCFLISLCVLTLAANVIWSRLVAGLHDTTRTDVSIHSQLQGVLAHPIGFGFTIFRTLGFFGLSYLEQFIGKLGYLDVKLPVLIIALYYIFIFLTATCINRGGKQVLIRQKLVMIFVFFLTFVMIMSALYLGYTPVGWKRIYGVQGRYFIPIAPLFFCLFVSLGKGSPGKLAQLFTFRRREFVAIAVIVVTLLATMNAYYQRYYKETILNVRPAVTNRVARHADEIPVMGDWDGDGVTDEGYYNAATHTFHLYPSSKSPVTFRIDASNPKLWPVAGDWDKKGKADLALYDIPKNQFAFYRSSDGAKLRVWSPELNGAHDDQWRPIAGQWEGDGQAELGLFNMQAKIFKLWSHNGKAIAEVRFGDQQADYLPIVGHWLQGSQSAFGLFQPQSQTLFLRYRLTRGEEDEKIKVPKNELTGISIPFWGRWDKKSKYEGFMILTDFKANPFSSN